MKAGHNKIYNVEEIVDKDLAGLYFEQGRRLMVVTL